MQTIKQRYLETIKPELMKAFSYDSVMEVPKVDKIVVNMGIGDAVFNTKALDDAVEELQALTGQKPVVTKAKKSISNFKLREGMPIGAKVTLRGDKMYYFLEKLIGIALPRVRDFRGISKDAFDGRGNYTVGIKEQIIFPEVNLDKVKKFVGWTLSLSRLQKQTKKVVPCYKHSACRLRSRRKSWLKNQKLLKMKNVLKSFYVTKIKCVNFVKKVIMKDYQNYHVTQVQHV